MKYSVVLTDEARSNVRDAVAWYAERSQRAANRWYDGLFRTINSLSEDPERCSLALENPRFPVELRQLNYGSGRHSTHRILFAVRSNKVVVHAIRHVAQEEWRPDVDAGGEP